MSKTIKITRDFINEAVMKSLERIIRESLMEANRPDDEEKETDEIKKKRDKVVSYLKEPGVNKAAYAYRLAGVDPEDTSGLDEVKLGEIRSLFYKKVENFEDPKTGAVYKFSPKEVNDLDSMIESGI